MNDWKARYARMKKHYGWTNADVAGMTGLSPDSVKQMVSTSRREFPRWLRLAVIIFEKEHPTDGTSD